MEEKKEKGLKNYWPLFALVLVALLAGLAVNLGTGGDMVSGMHYFMGFLFCEFALLKLFDIEGFADGFQMYDILAQKSREYAKAYPFIELALGLAYLSFFVPFLTYLVTIALMAIGTVGVFQSLQKGLNVSCACMGTILDVPLSTVTLTEDIGMGVMALLLLIQSF